MTSNTRCLGTSVEIFVESFPVKIWSVKSPSGEKRLIFFYLPDNFKEITSPRGKYLIIDRPQWIFEFNPDKVWYYLCDNYLNPWCLKRSCRIRGNAPENFPWNIKSVILIMIDMFLIFCPDFLW